MFLYCSPVIFELIVEVILLEVAIKHRSEVYCTPQNVAFGLRSTEEVAIEMTMVEYFCVVLAEFFLADPTLVTIFKIDCAAQVVWKLRFLL